MRIWEEWDTGPHNTWYETTDPVGTTHHTGFGEKAPTVEIPDELWERYNEAKNQIIELIAAEEAK